MPNALELDLNDPIHAEFIQAAANIYAAIFNIPLEKDRAKAVELARKVTPPPFVPKNVKIETEEKKESNPAPVIINEDDEKEIESLLNELVQYPLDPATNPSVVEFEKDDPSNFHIEFMGGVSNLRVLLSLCRLATIRSKKLITSR